VGRDANRQPLSFTGPSRQRQLGHARHLVVASGNHNLRFSVKVGDIEVAVGNQLFHAVERQAHNGGEPVAVGISLLH